ncbi:MAG: pyridoxamine 5'-phosphate oxidase family protein [Clostridiales bacterium]|nr:pyridoxamine 5'-phosphate oxidase family protein [Clostridiales bacterium]
MRRSDREIRDRQEIFDVLERCDVIRLGINTADYPYVVPMNFGMEADGDSLTIWLHCAREGLKLDNIKSDHRVGFEADCSHRLVVHEEASRFTMEYESVMGRGDVHVCHDADEKRRGLAALMRHYAPGREFAIPGPAVDGVCVLRLDVVEITGKRNKG